MMMKCPSKYIVHLILGCSTSLWAMQCSGCLHFAMPAMDAPQDESFSEQEEGDIDRPDGDGTINEDDSSDGEEVGEEIAPPIRGWSRTYGTAEGDESFNAIDPTTDGGFIATGIYDPFGPEAADFLVMKLDRKGEIEWQKRLGGIKDEFAYNAEQTEDGGFIVAGETWSFRENSIARWIVKLTPSGDIEWQRIYYNAPIISFSLRHTSDGGYIATGQYDHGSSTSFDFWLLKLDAAGNIMWQNIYTAPLTDYTASVSETQDGGFILTGDTTSFGLSVPTFLVLKVNGTGEVEWGKVYTHTSGQGYPGVVLPASDGGYILSGLDFPDNGIYSAFVSVKLDALGNVVWQQDYDVGYTYDAARILQASDGGYLLTGWGKYDMDTFSKLMVIKIYGEGYDRGYIEWQKQFDGPNQDFPRSAAEVTTGGYIIAGDTTSFGTGLQDAWIIRIDERGRIGQGCPSGFGEDSSVQQLFPYLTAEDAELTVMNSNLLVANTDAVPQDTNLVVITQCASD